MCNPVSQYLESAQAGLVTIAFVTNLPNSKISKTEMEIIVKIVE
jgi:hypothetical protein